MNAAATNSERPGRDIIWDTPRHPAGCQHQLEVIAVNSRGGVLKRCIKCGSLEEK